MSSRLHKFHGRQCRPDCTSAAAPGYCPLCCTDSHPDADAPTNDPNPIDGCELEYHGLRCRGNCESSEAPGYCRVCYTSGTPERHEMDVPISSEYVNIKLPEISESPLPQQLVQRKLERRGRQCHPDCTSAAAPGYCRKCVFDT